MTYCPKCKKWRNNPTKSDAVIVMEKHRFVKKCLKCGTLFIPNGKKSAVYAA